MEGQPTDSGDLSDPEDADTAAVDTDDTGEAAEAGTDEGAGAAKAVKRRRGTKAATATAKKPEKPQKPKKPKKPKPAKEPSAFRKWLVRNKTAVTVGGAVAAFVLSGAFAGAALKPYLVDRATVDTKMTIARTAADAITALWTYTPEDMDKLPERSAKYLSGDFEDQYRKFVDAIVATNKQAQVTNSTQVVAAAVESLSGDDATALVYTNTSSTTPQAKVPAMKYLSYRLQLKRDGTDWRVTKMTTVTALDLTPRL